jgi:RNA polymerase sigma-70 factor (ECF subfamily)
LAVFFVSDCLNRRCSIVCTSKRGLSGSKLTAGQVFTRKLFESLYPSLVRFLYRRLGDRDQAEDLAQESFIRLLANRPRAPRAWLYSVALNLARDAERAESRRSRRLIVLRGSDDEATSEPGPEAHMMSAEIAARVREALDCLSGRDRNLLTLREEGLSYREIAGVLGVSPTSIGPLLNRAQRRFLTHFDHKGKETIDDVETSG